MADYRHGAHGVLEIHPHLAWVARSRKPAPVGPVGMRLRELVREVCGRPDAHLLKGHVSKDPVPLLVSIPPQATAGRLVQHREGETASRMLQGFGPLREQFRGRPPWARGYFCSSSGDVTDRVVAEYVANQGESGPGDFRVGHGDFWPACGG